MSKIKVIYNSYITRFLNLDGLVLYPFVLLSTSNDETLPSILKHEVTHVHQIERDGFCKFYFQYCMHMCVDSYTNNIYEQEAFKNENSALREYEIIHNQIVWFTIIEEIKLGSLGSNNNR